MQKKVRITFKEEESSSLQFMAKLTQFKKTTKETKKKNSLVIHKQEWIKDWQKMNKLEGSLNSEVGYSCIQIDKIVGVKDNNIDLSMFTLHEDLKSKRKIEYVNIKYQVDNFKDIVKQLQSTKDKKKVQMEDFKELYADIKMYLQKLAESAETQWHELQRIEQTVTEGIDGEDLRLESDALIEEDSSEQALNSDIDIYSTTRGTLAKSKLQRMLENNKINKDQDDIINYFTIYSGGVAQKEEKKLLSQYNKAVSLLKERYLLEIQVIENDQDKKGRNEAPAAFKEENSIEQFRHIWKCYSGKQRELYIERLHLHFPKVQKLVIEVMDSTVQNQEYRRQKLEALFRAFVIERSELKRKAEQQIQDMLAQKVEENRKKTEKLALKNEQLRIQEELEEKRAEFMIRKQQKEEIEKQLKEEQEIENKKKQEIYEQRVKEVKAIALDFEEKKMKQEKEIKEKEDQIKLEQEEKLKEQVKSNKKYVEQRQEREKQKQEDKQIRKEITEKQKVINSERIEQAIESYQFRPQVECDPKRLKQPTEALIIKRQTKYDKADKIPLTQVYGFSANQLMKDMRYKLSSALADAGLQNTEYGKQILRYVHN